MEFTFVGGVSGFLASSLVVVVLKSQLPGKLLNKCKSSDVLNQKFGNSERLAPI